MSAPAPQLGDNLILAFDKPAGVLVRCDVSETDVARQRAKERNPRADEHGDTCDDETLDEAGLKKRYGEVECMID